MKKLLSIFLALLMLSTVLIATSCDKNEDDNNENVESDETSSENSENIEYPYPKVLEKSEQDGHYDQILGGKYLGSDFENSPKNEVSYKLIKTYEELVELVEYGKLVDEEIFEKNYVLVLKTEKFFIETRCFEKHSYSHFSSSKKQLMRHDVCEGHHVELDSPITITAFAYVVVPKNEFNADFESFGILTLEVVGIE